MLAIVLLVGCVDPDAPVVPGDETPVVFEVPKGATASRLGPKLAEQGLIPAEWKWKWFLRSADASCLKAGKFEVKRSMSLKELLAALCGPPLADDVPFTIVEGWRIRDIDAALAKAGIAPPGTYAAVATGKTLDLPFPVEDPTLEGYLYPETYKVSAQSFDVKKLVERQLETFRDRFLSKHPDTAPRTLHEIVVMASMLEREEPRPENRPLVAGILWKRLDHDTPLGVDATSRYALDDWNDRAGFLQHLRDPEDPYNSRLRKGLPPTAIGNPTVSSLEAALAPVASANWYYLHDAQGNLHPARNAAEHEANRDKYDVH